ncbi:hypothetical protein [Phytoactinopolyspora halotolerans]|uniref:Lipoprotein n=1 Tax=Phytoactinopolyspora halotolerans TaxID=1981512 RepID=A0A6L9SF45_9ACTN|nr:hypothetical protein [Phytoactinopolyspora halotolerans]NEE03284.1 hypothetical protein [Phytoactinopolyspora halotolerans]
MSSARTLTSSTVAGAVMLLPLLGACSDGSSSEAEAERVVLEFAEAIAAEDVVAMCRMSAVAGRPASEGSSSASLCEDVLAPMILESSEDVKAALDAEAVPAVTVDGSEAAAELEGVSSPFGMIEVEDEWLVVVG